MLGDHAQPQTDGRDADVYQEYGFTSPEQLEAAVDTAYQEMRRPVAN